MAASVGRSCRPKQRTCGPARRGHEPRNPRGPWPFSGLWTLGLWFIALITTGSGYLAGRLVHGSPGFLSQPVPLVAGALAMSLFAVFAAARATSRHTAMSRLAVAVAMLGLARGYAHAISPAVGEPPLSPWRGAPASRTLEDGPALGSGIVEFAVVGASMPGPTCEVTARHRDTQWELALPAEACPLAEGQRIRLPWQEIRLASSPWPSESGLLGDLGSRGSRTRLESSRAFPEGDVTPYWGWVARLRQTAFAASRGNDAASFAVASTIGINDAMTPAWRGTLRDAGLGHIVSVSGVHTSAAILLLRALLMRVAVGLGSGGFVRLVLFVALFGVTAAYVGLTGASPPAVRAGAMLSLALIGEWIARPSHGLVHLVAVGAVMMFHRPALVLDPSFVLSMTAMAAVVTAPRDLSVVAASLRITLAITPVSIGVFGEAPIAGIVANLVAIPVFSVVVLPLGLLGVACLPWLGEVALAPAGWGAQLILDTGKACALVPPLGPKAWVIVAGSCLAIHATRTWGSPRLSRLLSSCPGPTGPLLTLVAAVTVPAPVPPPPGSLFVVGTKRAHAAVFLPPGDPNRAWCVTPYHLDVWPWPGLWASLSIREVSRTGPPGLPTLWPPDDPRVAVVRAPHCTEVSGPPVSKATTQSLLRSCLRRHPQGLALVRVTPDGAAECFVSGVFRPLPPLSTWSDRA